MASAAAEDAAREAGETVGNALAEISEAEISNVVHNMENDVNRIAQDIASGQAPEAAAFLDVQESGAAAAAQAEADMRNIIQNDTPQVSTELQNLVRTEQADAESAARDAVEERARTEGRPVSPDEASAIAKSYSKKAILNSIAQKGWVVLKYSAFGAVALLVMKNFFAKLLKSFPVYVINCDNNKNLSIRYADSSVSFYEGDMCSVSLNKKYSQQFKALAGKNDTDDDNEIYMKVIKVDGVTITLQQSTDVGCPTNTIGTGSVNDPVGKLRCKPDLAHDLIHGTGEDLDELMKEAGKAAGGGAKSFWDQFGGSIKIIIYIIIAIVILSIITRLFM